MDELPNKDGRNADPSQSPADSVKKSATEVSQVVHDAASGLKATAKEQAGAIKYKAMSAIGDAQANAADQARSAASTLRNTAAGLDGGLPWMGTVLNKTADGLEGLTSALSTGDINDAFQTVNGFARRQPALFLGLSVAAGFALARVGKTALESVHADARSSLQNGLTPSAPAP